jgi:hypothetical protein
MSEDVCITCADDYEFNWTTYLCESTIVVCMENCDVCSIAEICTTCATGYETA